VATSDTGSGTTAPLGDRARERERALLIGLLLDLLVFFPYLAIAIWSNSLTLIGEIIRGGLLILLEVYLMVLMRRIHRSRVSGYEYGTGNLEQFGNLAVGVAMIGAALWMVASIALRWAEPVEHADGGLLLGIGMTVLNLGMNLGALRSVWKAGRDGTSIILNGQIRSRLSKTISSAVVVVAAATNALAAGHWIGTMADLVGAAFVVCVMVSLGVELCRKALPPLVDQTLDEGLQVSINRVLASRFDDFDALGRVRSRQVGGGAVVEVHLGFAASRSLGEVQSVADEISAEIRRLIPGAEVVAVPFAVGMTG
jgi:divalent metal cation (Fe/Co/Zn/Cd) transporter